MGQNNIIVTVFCAGSNNVSDTFLDVATQLGSALGECGFEVRYGGGSQGLMGRLYTAYTQCSDKKPLGIIVQELIHPEKANFSSTSDLIEVDIFDRKRRLISEANFIVVLPGGIGTIDELFDALVLKSHSMIDSEIILVNCNGFFDELIDYLGKLSSQGFIRAQLNDLMKLCETASDALTIINDSQDQENEYCE